MILKEIFSKNQNVIEEITVKKILNKNIYEKSYIRSSLSDSNIVQTIDNNSQIFNLSNQTFFKVYGKVYQNVEGLSVNTNSYTYKNKLNSDLKFKSFILNSVRDKNIVDSFYGSLKGLKESDTKVSNSLLVLKPVKGGFICYSSGVCGFLPRSHGIRLITLTLILSLKTKQFAKRIINLASLICRQSRNKISFLFRLEFILGKVALYLPIIKQNNFSQTSRRKKKDFVNDYNFVFLSQRVQKLKNNLIKSDAKNNQSIKKQSFKATR